MIDTDRLKQSVNILDLVTEELNKKLKNIEDELKEIGPGLVVWVSKGNDKNVSFGYYRFKDNWHLAVKIKDEEPRPVLESARYYRYACYKVRQQIIDALNESAISSAKKWHKILKELDGKDNF